MSYVLSLVELKAIVDMVSEIVSVIEGVEKRFREEIKIDSYVSVKDNCLEIVLRNENESVRKILKVMLKDMLKAMPSIFGDVDIVDENVVLSLRVY